MALRELGDEAAQLTWRYGAFELDPTVPAEGVDAIEYLEAKYDAATVAGMYERLKTVMDADGLAFDPGAARKRPNTFAAHRLLTAALEDGPERQQVLADELFRAHWAEGRDVGDAAVLAGLAAAAGFGAERAARALADEAYDLAVRDEERAAQQAGIHAVPTFVFGGRVAVSGAHPPAVLVAAARRALTPSGD